MAEANRLRWSSVLCVVIWLLSACAGVQQPGKVSDPQSPPSWQQRKASIEALSGWDVSGRAAINDGSQSWQTSVTWQQQDDDYTIELIGPFGQGQVKVRGDAQGVSLREGNRIIRADDADSLFERSTGTRLPISGLQYWIRGIPDPAQTSRLAFDEQGRPVRIEQSGWIIEILNYIEVAGLPEPIELPKRINAEQADLKVKIIIQTWQLPN